LHPYGVDYDRGALLSSNTLLALFLVFVWPFSIDVKGEENLDG